MKSLEILEGVQSQLMVEPFKAKLLAILDKDPDLEAMKNISSILKSDSTELHNMDPNLPYNFKCTPITYVDCERTFLR